MLAHVRPLRLDHRVVDLEAEVLGELLEEENVLRLFVGLMNGLDLLVDGAHQLHHLGVVVDGHDLAAPRIRDDERKELHVPFAAGKGTHQRRCRRQGDGRGIAHAHRVLLISLGQYHMSHILTRQLN